MVHPKISIPRSEPVRQPAAPQIAASLKAQTLAQPADPKNTIDALAEALLAGNTIQQLLSHIVFEPDRYGSLQAIRSACRRCLDNVEALIQEEDRTR
jgi:hypothetical protein